MRLVLKTISAFRRWVFLPSLVASVSILIVFKGGDALSVCFNTIAILFLCDIDNVAFQMGLSESLRSRVENSIRVELDDSQAGALIRSRLVHMLMIFATTLVSVKIARFPQMQLVNFCAFLVGGIVDAAAPAEDTTLSNKAKDIGLVICAWIAGFIIWLMSMLIASGTI